MVDTVEGAKLVKGIWFPEYDTHLPDMVENHSKTGVVNLLDGRQVGTYQKHKLDFAMGLVPHDKRQVAVDVGAHVGLWSMHLGDLFRSVVAFEPIPDFQRLFEINLNGNPRVRLVPEGLGASKGFIKLVMDPLNTGNTHELGADEGRETAVADAELTGRLKMGADRSGDGRQVSVQEVPIQRLDAHNLTNVGLIKIDVEGAELQVVKGARRTIMESRPVVIVEQKGNDAKFHNSEANAAGEYLRSLGMKLIRNFSGDWIMQFPEGG
jgi:FkbM family methyltransferase